jgi:hypothetical protein
MCRAEYMRKMHGPIVGRLRKIRLDVAKANALRAASNYLIGALCDPEIVAIAEGRPFPSALKMDDQKLDGRSRLRLDQ